MDCLGILGSLVIEDKRLATITQGVFFTGMAFSMRFAPGALSLHHFLQLLPFVTVGAANSILKVRDHVKREANRDVANLVQKLPCLERRRSLLQRLSLLPSWVVLFSLLVFYGVRDFRIILYGNPQTFYRQIDLVLVRNPEGALAVTDYVNRQVDPEDIVVASPHIAWRVKANATDFEQFMAYQGLFSVNYGEEGVPPERFAFAPLLENTKFVIVDNMWEEWAIPYEMPVLEKYLQIIQSSWELVLKQGDFKVYRNPAFFQQR